MRSCCGRHLGWFCMKIGLYLTVRFQNNNSGTCPDTGFPDPLSPDHGWRLSRIHHVWRVLQGWAMTLWAYHPNWSLSGFHQVWPGCKCVTWHIPASVLALRSQPGNMMCLLRDCPQYAYLMLLPAIFAPVTMAILSLFKVKLLGCRPILICMYRIWISIWRAISIQWCHTLWSRWKECRTGNFLSGHKDSPLFMACG